MMLIACPSNSRSRASFWKHTSTENRSRIPPIGRHGYISLLRGRSATTTSLLRPAQIRLIFSASRRTRGGDDMPRAAAEAADAKADDEVRQLRLLREILKDNPDVYSPKVIGRNKAVVALEYIQGEDVSHLVSEKRLDERMIGKISGVLSGLHASLEAKADYIKREFPIPEWHTANSVVCLEKKTAALSERDRNGDFDAGIFSRFTELVRKSQALIEEMGYRDFPDAIYGDFKGENMIAMPDGRVAVLDPVLCAGRRSMDIAKFGRSLYFNDPSAYAAHFAEFISAYEEKTHRTVNRSEVAHMLGFDMLNSMRGHLLLPQRAASVFPAPVTHVRDNIMFYLSAVEEALGGSTRLPS